MLAQLFVQVPFDLALADGEPFPVFEIRDAEHTIRVLPPIRAGDVPPRSTVDTITIDEKPAFLASVLRIDFSRAEFDRRETTLCDPTHEAIASFLEWLLERLRYVAGAAFIRPLSFPQCAWELRYRNDDGSELEPAEGLVRMRGGRAFHLQWAAVTPQIWTDVFTPEEPAEVPPWELLLLDARAALPEVGPSIVLAHTAIEVCIAHHLSAVAQQDVTKKALWAWVESREWIRQPGIADQLSELFDVFVGASLKREEKLWEKFRWLNRARNTFVHEGVAKIGDEIVSHEQTRDLIAATRTILDWIRSSIPPDMQWKQYQHAVRVNASIRVLPDDA